MFRADTLFTMRHLMRVVRQQRIVLAIVAILLVVASLMAALDLYPMQHEHAYSVATVQAGLQHQPRQWVGRTVLVEGKVADVSREFSRLGAGRSSIAILLVPLTVSTAPTRVFVPYRGAQLEVSPHLRAHPLDGIVNLLRRIPFVGQVFPASDGWRQVDTIAVFRLTILPRHKCPTGLCASSPDALLVDK